MIPGPDLQPRPRRPFLHCLGIIKIHTLQLMALSVLVGSLGLPGWAGADAWDVHSDANNLASVTVSGDEVWCASRLGLHRFDTTNNQFERFFREPGGLVSNQIVTAAIDSMGTVWLGSEGAGVSLLTTNNIWRLVTEFEGLPSDSVLSLEAFEQGMWVGTTNGLGFFVGGEIIALWPDGVNPSPFRSNRIQAIESAGTITWVGTEIGVNWTVDGITWSESNSGLRSQDILSLEHTGNELWAVTDDGLVYSERQSGDWSLRSDTLSGPFGVDLGSRDGALYLGATDGVHRWNSNDSSWVFLAGPDNANVDVGANGDVWAGNSAGLWRWTGVGGWARFRSPAPSGNYIHGMALEGDALYVTTRFNGASRYSSKDGWRSFLAGASSDTSLKGNTFLFACLADREGFKWFGDWDGSIARFNDASAIPQVTHFFDNADGDSSHFTWAWSSAHDPQGYRWFGLDTCCRGAGPEFDPRGMIRLDSDGTRNNFLPANSAMSGNQVRSIAFAPNGQMWVGYADRGVDVFSDRSLGSRVARLESGNGTGDLTGDNVWSIVFQGNDAWVLVDGSAVRMSLNGSTATRRETIFLPSISTAGAVNPMVLDSDGGLWIATTRGVIHRKPDGNIEAFNTSNSPLLSDDVHSLVFNSRTGDLWIGTGIGINRLRPSLLGGEISGGIKPLVVSPNPIRYSVINLDLLLTDSDGEVLVRTDVDIYDGRGRFISRVRTDDLGRLSWPGQDRFGRRLTSGVYLFRAMGFDENGHRVPNGSGRLVLTP